MLLLGEITRNYGVTWFHNISVTELVTYSFYFCCRALASKHTIWEGQRCCLTQKAWKIEIFCLTDSAHAHFGFSLSDATINVLTICCQIPVMSNLAFSLRDVTINVLTICCQIPVMSNLAISLRDVTIDAYLTPHVRTYLTPHVYLLAVKRWAVFFIASIKPQGRHKVGSESVTKMSNVRQNILNIAYCNNGKTI